MRTLSEKTDASSAVDGVEAQFSNSNKWLTTDAQFNGKVRQATVAYIMTQHSAAAQEHQSRFSWAV